MLFPSVRIQSAGMLAYAWIHFHLHPFNVRSMFGIDACTARVEKHAAVARRFALEFQAQVEIAIRLFRRQVAILVGGTFAKDGAMVHNPLLCPIIFPAS